MEEIIVTERHYWYNQDGNLNSRNILGQELAQSYKMSFTLRFSRYYMPILICQAERQDKKKDDKIPKPAISRYIR